MLPKLHNIKFLKHLVWHDIPSLGEFVKTLLIRAFSLEKWVNFLAFYASFALSCQLLVLLIKCFLHPLLPVAHLFGRGIGILSFEIHLFNCRLFSIGTFVVLCAALKAEIRCVGKQKTTACDTCPLVLNDFLFLFVQSGSWEMSVFFNMCVNLIKNLVGQHFVILIFIWQLAKQRFSEFTGSYFDLMKVPVESVFQDQVFSNFDFDLKLVNENLL